jgi:RHS repeat-associated protein
LQYLRDGAKLWNNGRLLQRVYKQNNTELLKRDYLSNKEYKSGILENINHACGRIIKNGSIFNYEYNLTDHLGNVRTVFSDSNNDSYISATEVMQRNDYYAFGLELQGSQFNIPQPVNSNRFKYNGKEEVSQMNLGLLDYGARNLDKALGRWLGVDPLTDHPNQVDKSPYAYAWNNPVRLTDPDGRCPICPFLAKGAAGAAVDYMLQGAFNYAGGMSMSNAFAPSNIDKSDVALSGLQGMIPWSVPGGKYGKAAASAVSDVMFNYGKSVLNGEDYTMEQASKDFLIGFGAQLGSEKVGELFGNKLDNLVKSFDDLANNPKAIWGKSADEVGKMLGDGWEKADLNSGDGWKFVQKNGDGFVSYTTGNSHHPGSEYYKINSGTYGKNKVVGPGYVPTKDDKSTIFTIE